MAVVNIEGAPPGENRFKAAAPVAAGGLGIVAAIIGVFALTGPETPAPAPLEAPLSANPPAAAPGPGASIPGVQFDQAPGADIVDAGKAQPFQRVMDRPPLGVEHAVLQADMDADFHG